MNYCPRCAGEMNERLIDLKPRPVCHSCGFIFYQGPKLATAVVVLQNGKVLLNKRDIEPEKGKWSFPSGYVDLGETVEQAAIRETREETGLDIHLHGLVGVYSNAERPVVLVVYLGAVSGGALTVGRETQDVQLFDLRELPDLAFDHDDDIIADALRLKVGYL